MKDLDQARCDYYKHFGDDYLITVPSNKTEEEIIEAIYDCIERDAKQEIKYEDGLIY